MYLRNSCLWTVATVAISVLLSGCGATLVTGAKAEAARLATSGDPTEKKAGQNILRSDQEHGYIMLHNGIKKEGVIWLHGGYANPTANQSIVRWVSDERWNSPILMTDQEWTPYTPGQIEGYGVGSRYYRSVPYEEELIAIGSKVQHYFLEQIVGGHFNVYHIYGTNRSGKPTLILQKKGGRLFKFNNVDLAQYIADCPTIYDKYQEGGYGVTPRSDGKRRGMKGMMNRFLDTGLMTNELVIPIARDYNTCVDSDRCEQTCP